MGFPVCCADVYFPNPFLHARDILDLFRNLAFFFLHLLGLSQFPQIELPWLDPFSFAATGAATSAAQVAASSHEISAPVIRKLLPVVRFGESGENACECAFCLFEFSEEAEIRRMRNCKHIFHRACVDRWIDQDQKTCPLCRTPFVSNLNNHRL